MTTAKPTTAAGARPLAPAQLDVAQSPTAADLVATLVEQAVERLTADADAAGLGRLFDASKRALTRHVGQLRRLHDAGE